MPRRRWSAPGPAPKNDVWLALEVRGDHATARRLAAEFVEDVRLLEDIGWDPRGRPPVI